MSVITAPFLKLSSSLCDPLKLYIAFTRVTPATPDILTAWDGGVFRAHFIHTHLNSQLHVVTVFLFVFANFLSTRKRCQARKVRKVFKSKLKAFAVQFLSVSSFSTVL